MRKSLYAFVACTSLLLSSSCKKNESDPTPTAPEETSTVVYKPLNGKSPLVIGHRGYAGLRPDHTLEGYRLAIELGADFVEPDLVMTKDSILICRHEPMLSTTTNVKDLPEFASYKTTKMVDGVATEDWFASDFTLSEIKKLRAIQPLGSRSKAYDGLFAIPTFQEMIDLVKEETKAKGRTIGIYPETKHPTFHEDLHLNITDKVLEVLTTAGWNSADAPVYLQSFEVSNLQYARSKSTLKLVQLIDADDVDDNGNIVLKVPYAQPYDFVKSGNSKTFQYLTTNEGLDFVKTYANGIGPWKPYVIPYKNKNKEKLAATDLIQRAHERNLVVHLFTFRDEANYLLKEYNGDPKAEYKAVYDMGVDGVFSDFTATAVAARK